MKVIETEVYKCDYCGKNLIRKHAMIKHEKFCDRNPLNIKACFGCVFLTKEEVLIEEHDHYDRKSNGFRCTKKDVLLYPTKVERKGLLDKYPETFEDQEPMPSQCDLHEYPKF